VKMRKPRRFGSRNKPPASAIRPFLVNAIRDLLGISAPSYTAAHGYSKPIGPSR
jgi:hypothetical protein